MISKLTHSLLKNQCLISRQLVRVSRKTTFSADRISHAPKSQQIDDQKAYIDRIITAYEKGIETSSRGSGLKRFRFLLLCGMLGYLAYNLLSGRVRFIESSSITLFNMADDITTTFDDVKGCDEVKKELQDIVHFLKKPDSFNDIGATLPRGVLLSGPPGVGKTLLARAVAGEAEVPFIFASGSSFEGIFVGTGANKVKNLFELARKNAPCVIFIDEIDSIGRTRTNSAMHPYANQTINQLLAEMDGFQQNEGIIVLGATNKYEDLDKAITRPGRFDSHIMVSAPNYKGRLDLFHYYINKIKAANNIDFAKLAVGSVGYTGADIQNLVNQAAIAAALKNSDCVTMDDLWIARDKILMGPEKKKPDDDLSNKIAAYHEAGHALVSFLTKDSVPIHKVTIIPRGGSGGHTSFMPDEDRSYLTKSQLLAQLDTMMGGRVGEEIIFGLSKITTGASSDFTSATRLATSMVSRYGFSEKFGLRVVNTQEQEQLLSPETKKVLEEEVDRLLNESINRARQILKNNQDKHHKLAQALLKYETLTRKEVEDILNDNPKDGKGSKKKSKVILIEMPSVTVENLEYCGPENHPIS